MQLENSFFDVTNRLYIGQIAPRSLFFKFGHFLGAKQNLGKKIVVFFWKVNDKSNKKYKIK